MVEPAELREQARRYAEAAKKETEPETRRKLRAEALALAQLAEKVERGQGGSQPAGKK